MRVKIIIAVLAVTCICLVVALVSSSRKPEIPPKIQEVINTVTVISNSLDQTRGNLEELKHVNMRLTNMLQVEELKVDDRTKQLKQLESDVQRVTIERDDLKKQVVEITKSADDAAKTAQQEIEKGLAQIAKLEQERDTLVGQMAVLTNKISVLEIRIAETEKKLASTEGEKDLLMKELKRLMTEKADLEQQFNNLKIVKEQVKKLTEEHHVALRLEWMRKGLYNNMNMKGGEILARGVPKPKSNIVTNRSLDVELRKDAPAVIKSTPVKPSSSK